MRRLLLSSLSRCIFGFGWTVPIRNGVDIGHDWRGVSTAQARKHTLTIKPICCTTSHIHIHLFRALPALPLPAARTIIPILLFIVARDFVIIEHVRILGIKQDEKRWKSIRVSMIVLLDNSRKMRKMVNDLCSLVFQVSLLLIRIYCPSTASFFFGCFLLAPGIFNS